ncbi:MAG: PLP-dependent transferase [Halobacteriovoraceae bacterium]|jgi:cystathionine gamma-lyase / homocysteine desulfhydrase|nr:PLP-dependent transferase [Halobacteriovoraceae bacterium]
MKDLSLSAQTIALHTKTPLEGADPSVTPIFQNSAFENTSPYFYTRKANPNSQEFEEVIKTFEEANHAISVTTGMTAISLVINLLDVGQTLVINKDIYGCSYKLFQRFVKKRKINLVILDLSVNENLVQIPNNADMILFETPTNPFLKTINIEKVSKVAKKDNPKCLIVVDNTWATPLFQKPLKHGADISLYSATKYFSGHSDVMGGIIVTDDTEIAETLREERFYGGAILAPYGAWLLRRSLQTLKLRMQEHQRITQDYVDFLRDIPQVKKIYFPQVDGHQLEAYGGILFFEFSDELIDPYPTFMSTLKLFGTGTGMACVTSMVAQPHSGSHASMNEAEKKEMGITPKLARLCFGFEDPEDIKNDLKLAFAALKS